MPQTPGFHVLIPAAGAGRRAGGGTPKQYRVIHKKAILRHTIEVFLSLEGLKSLRVIVDPKWVKAYHDAVQGLDLPDPVPGGKTRKQSVNNGIKEFLKLKNEEIIVIHDGARPFVRPADILAIVRAAQKDGAAALATPIADTVVEQKGYVYVDREHLRAIQTPQAFQFGLLKKALKEFEDNENFTDDAGLIAGIGHPVTLVEGCRTNTKITTPEDLLAAEKLLAPSLETRFGLGFDIHRFSDTPAKTIRLGGVDIPYPRAIEAHSDGDVILHALTDALLGSIGAKDIGQIFPPSDPQWENADSHIFVEAALARVHAQGGRVIHADIAVQAEAPKLSPHRAAITLELAKILDLAPEHIGLKATTMEQLGEIGAGKGLAAQAIVTVEFPT